MDLQLQQKERKGLEEQDPALSQAKRRKQMISSLPKFFDMIYFLFQSGRRMVITKEELIHNVISSHLEIADRSKRGYNHFKLNRLGNCT